MEFEDAIELLFEMSTKVVIDVDARVKNSIVNDSFGMFEDLGKELSCKAKASVMKRKYASFYA